MMRANCDDISRIELSFLKTLSCEDKKLLLAYRQGMDCQNEVFSKIGPILEVFLLKHFNIEKPYQLLQKELSNFDPLLYFYQKIALPNIRKIRIGQLKEVDAAVEALAREHQLDELHCIQTLLENFDEQTLSAWAQSVWIEKKAPYIHWTVFIVPKKINFQKLVEIKSIKPRLTYDWIGPSLGKMEVIKQSHYCIDCHIKDNDSCSKGFWLRKDQAYKVNPLGRVLTGCPLNQKISQMHGMKKRHHILAALAIIMVDNPLCLVTGDRICNDCMVSCIYQKVEPVDTPSVESDTVRQILNLPYGAEIYLLLAMWNPLKAFHYQCQTSMLANIAVVGMGPSGFAMSYYLLMAGCRVVGFDGLPIAECEGAIYEPIENFDAWASNLQDKVSGFGGVIDYGITARWDKRLILLIWVLLRRFPRFTLKGSVRLGGAITIEGLNKSGFDHVVLATGAGLPNAHPIQHKLGIYFANEFLMRLHLSGMMHHEIRIGMKLPIVVIGGGLTAIDAATEAQVHYIRFTMQVAFWVESVGMAALTQGLSDRELTVINTWYEHGCQIRRYQTDTKKLNNYIQSQGGVHILYRRSMVDSPAYRTNFMELSKALEQGILYHEKVDPISVESQEDWVEAVLCQSDQGKLRVEAKTVLIATGSKPNIAYYFENRSEMKVEDRYYKRQTEFLADTEILPGYVSIIGDLHPKYHGSVVGALASAKDSYAGILAKLKPKKPLDTSVIESMVDIKISTIFAVSDQVLELQLDTEIELPIGSYIKIALNDKGVIIQLKAVVINSHQAWLDRSQMGSELMDNTIVGVLGPSGTRILSHQCSDTVHVVFDDTGVIFAKSVISAANAQGKRALVYAVNVDSQILNTEILSLEQLSNHSDEDVIYCLSPDHLKMMAKDFRFREAYAICDGPMMCMLKGVCGQCIQWQVNENMEQVKAVFSCSWQAQPVVLIDIDHFSIRNRVETIENTLYNKWKQLLMDGDDRTL